MQETWIRALSGGFNNIPKTWIQIQACRQKANVMSGCPQHPKKTGMRIWCFEETSAKSWVKLPAHPKREEMNSRRSLGEAACTSKEKLRRVPGGLQIVTSQEFSFWSFPSPYSSTHLSLLFLTKWRENPVAESWGSRWTGTCECHQFWVREANVLSWHCIRTDNVLK